MASNQILTPIYIIDGARTPIASTYKSLKTFLAAQLASFVIDEICKRYPQIKEKINQVILGNTVSAGTGQNMARHAVSLSMLDISTPAFVINSVCGSGLESVIVGAQAILSGQADLVLAGGTESASHNPQIIKNQDELIESLLSDGLWCVMSDFHMGQLAENLAEEFNVSREAQDQLALESHQKAFKAQEQGKFDEEIVPIKKENGEIFSRDERIRKNISLERMTRLPSSFKESGTVTPGNASSAADAAALVLLAGEQAMKKYGFNPKARILGYSSVALEPKNSFLGAIKAAEECLKKCNLKNDDIDLFEIGESFASQAVLTKERLNIKDSKFNIFGGDIALGHPLGSTATRILVTLLHALKDQNKKIGLMSICFGGGGGVSMIIERL
ncbi:MAG: thiolase family protein [Candidatus Omnitrophica bacterium]|nr:thiolase family protein [Candidatus Omnitrophota bacterium]